MQARAACLAFPYMIDAQLLAAAVTDASKGGEEAFGAWTAQQMEQMRAMHRVSPHGPGGSGAVHATGTAAVGTRAAPNDGAQFGARSANTAAAASEPLAEVAASAREAEHIDGVMLPSGASRPGGDEPMTLSQIAACHVADVLRQAGVRTPASGPAQPAAPFGIPPVV